MEDGVSGENGLPVVAVLTVPMDIYIKENVTVPTLLHGETVQTVQEEITRKHLLVSKRLMTSGAL